MQSSKTDKSNTTKSKTVKKSKSNDTNGIEPINFPQTPQSTWQLIATAFKLSVKSFKHIYPIFICYCLAIFVVDIFTDYCGKGECVHTTGQVFGLGVLYIIWLFVIAALFTASLYQFYSLTQNQAKNFGDALKFGVNKAIPMGVLYILYVLAIAIGLILLLVPGIFIAVTFVFGIVFLVKGSGVVDALAESNRLVSHNWWRTFFNFLIVSIFLFLCALIYFFITFPGLIYYGQIHGLFTVVGKEAIIAPNLRIAFSFVTVIFQFFSTIYMLAFILSCYYDLQLRKAVRQ